MPYTLRGRCVVRSDTGDVVKCHPTRAKALRHLAALQINVTEAKMSKSLSAIKQGARHSASDQKQVQSIHDSAAALGASCDAPDAAAVKMMVGADPGMYVAGECNDVYQAASALQSLTMLIQGEIGEGDERDDAQIAPLCQAARLLITFISGELDEIDGFRAADATEDSAGDTGDLANVPSPTVVDMSYAGKIAAREDVNPKAGASEYGDVQFADAKNKLYPLDTEAHIRATYSYFSMPKNAGKYSAEDQATIRGRIIAAWKKKIDKDGPPSAAETKTMGLAIKMTDDDIVYGPAIFFGSEEMHDLSPMKDFFTKSTDMWLGAWDTRPMIWHHSIAQDDIIDEMRKSGAVEDEIKAMRDALAYFEDHPVIGTWTKATVDPLAVWFKGQLSKAHQYRDAIKRMIDAGMIKISTDSAPHLVRRVRTPSGAHEVKRWPIAAASLTIQAAEPRLFDVQAVKSMYEAAGIQLPFAIYDDSEAQADDTRRADELKADQERARKLSLTLALMELTEATV